ncbi:winged helix-turn-helix transcriptional regulator [Glycomyces buryatensis]|uniref:Helix-turn-helix transcriptional regulator n=1 Tax=Glycomyces buryatensis TaxID=2570927 RepID=A0A4S8QDX9_9ACTN|nr:helix-turn-helix domain-containing protein [Glycomyces buryatensis]THV42530.1 helix-turn-helix transcriptional regulator [Glycomyces buryatensis]
MSDRHTAVPSMVSAPLPDPVPVGEYERCPVTDILRRVGDKWSILVIVLLGKRPYRFNELHRGIEVISQRMLTRTLRGLETDGLVHREVFPTKPPSVEYSLTPLGRTLLAPLSGLADWAVEHGPDIMAARAALDLDSSGETPSPARGIVRESA